MSQTVGGEGAGGKVCVVCREDCSQRPRLRDPQGKYVCKACADKVAAKMTKAGAASTVPSSTVPSRAGQNGPPADDEMLVIPELAPMPAPKPFIEQAEIGIDGEVEDPKILKCPQCKIEKRKGERVCGRCGFDPTTLDTKKIDKALRKKLAKDKPATCRECGYDMRGAPSLVCPECGHQNRTSKPLGMRDDEEDVRKQMYRQPVMMMIIGLVVSMGLAALAGPKAPSIMGTLLIYWLVTPLIMTAAFWVASLFYLEYDAPMHVTLLRMYGIFAIAMIPDALGFAIGIPAFGLLRMGLLWLMYVRVLEIEVSEAVVMSIVGGVLTFGIALGAAFVVAMF